MKKLLSQFFLLLVSAVSMAQVLNPVRFTSKMNIMNDNEAEILFTATIDKGWHVYSHNLGADGPIQASFNINRMEGASPIGNLSHRGTEIKHMDTIFGMELRYFEQSVTFVQKIRFTARNYVIDCYLEYGACNDESCLPPSQVQFTTKGELESKEEKTAIPTSTDNSDSTDIDKTNENHEDNDIYENNEFNEDNKINEYNEAIEANKSNEFSFTSLWSVFLAGLLSGFLALLTPCVWPIIPMTVSFFLKRNKSRHKAVKEALTYGVSIVVIYVLLGLAVTLIFGASALNAMSTNAVVNILFALLLIIFAASFLGAFEIALPSSWSTKVDSKAEKMSLVSTHLSILLMAFTLVITSFSCTGPIIGFLLVAVGAQGNLLAPTTGMLGFAVALAIPFTLFAVFPSLLKTVPKSGGWMNVIKVSLAFIELAFALKFLSVADLAYGWHLLDREVFLSLWIVIFALLGAYLLGWIRFPHDSDDRHISVTRFFLALLPLAFTIYMIPGLWGAPLKAISAFTPPLYTQDFRNASGNRDNSTVSVEAQFRDYDEGLAFARKVGKPLVLDFTGFGCVNCRKMEAAVWTDPTVAKMLTHDFVLVSLYVDDKTPLASTITVKENGVERTLKTLGDKWSYFQRSRFKANTQPFYVIIDTEGNQIGPHRSYDEDVSAYINWLKGAVRK